ncbi:hypothetical protein [Chitinophaga sp. CF418]|uniref:hypothetical protein n=1 Tax=Chitinophaga sp. CF418 TaxID=1855287 RepID=UPI0009157555|nr:hypothetical protein [Chitinophaga sp. CF418]SHL89212.1 hypothetical protein SAMN05216311_10155 [Chitinophaga sp. CF418]
MEKLLAKKGIEFLSYTDEEGSQISYAFTNNMLKQGIIVVLSEWQYEVEEEEEESEEWEETVETNGDEQEAWEEDTIEEGEAAPDALNETTVSVILTKGGVSYEFGIYADDRAVVPVIYLYRVILDLIDIISGSDADSLLEALESVSTTVSSSDDYVDEPETRNQLYNLTVEHLEKAARLLAER